MNVKDPIYQQAQRLLELGLLDLFMEGALSAEGLRGGVECIRTTPPPTEEQEEAIIVNPDFQALVARGEASGDPLGVLAGFAKGSIRDIINEARGGDDGP